MSTNILVIGGAGYIGSHMVKMLLDRQYTVTVLDNLSSGRRDVVPNSILVEGDMGDAELLARVFGLGRYDAVMHFASFIQATESVSDPGKYYKNNLGKTLCLLEAMRHAKVNKLVFSSSSAVYGNPVRIPIREPDPKDPINPYGRAKLMVEQILHDYSVAYSMQSISLRYFNAAGADPEGTLGERHEPETHLIPLVLQVAAGLKPRISVYGNDYDTHDGTCIRDYIHLHDLCRGHLLALVHLLAGGSNGSFNLGGGKGASVLEVIKIAEQISGKFIPVSYEKRRQGDADLSWDFRTKLI
jgi:UDP-glucose 4-epimerase